MATTWIVSANAGRARFFSQTQPGSPLEEINDMVNTAAHLTTAETESDRIGQRSASNSIHSVGAPTTPSGYQPNQTPSQHQAELFARSIADFLQKNHQNGRFQQLILTASPEFLGELRKLLDPTLHKLVSLEINKDYTQSRPEQLLDHVQTHQQKS